MDYFKNQRYISLLNQKHKKTPINLTQAPTLSSNYTSKINFVESEIL
jgi:hypothetical protein